MEDASTQLPSNREELEAFLRSYEAYFLTQQKAAGMKADALTVFEKAILASFVVWLRDHAADGEIAYAHHQAG